MNEQPYAGFYINLDRCPERRAEIESELARYGLTQTYRRFAAADGNSLNLPNPRMNEGEMGCFLSHYLVLKENRGTDRHLHIIEDDVIFADCTDQVLRRMIQGGEIDAFDVLFTDAAMPLSNEAYRDFKIFYDKVAKRDANGELLSVAFQTLGLDRIPCNTGSSYIVNKRSVEKLYRLYDEELMRGAELPFDIFLRELALSGTVRAGCVFPFITSVRIEHIYNSTVRKTADVTLRFTAANIARYSFFIGCDWSKCAELADRLPQLSETDRHAAILARVLAFSLVEAGKQEDRSSQAA